MLRVRGRSNFSFKTVCISSVAINASREVTLHTHNAIVASKDSFCAANLALQQLVTHSLGPSFELLCFQCFSLLCAVVFVKASGWVGTHQQPNRHWSTFDSSGESHYYRAFSFPWLAAEAKKAGIASAQKWYPMDDGSIALTTPFALNFDVSVRLWAQYVVYKPAH